MGKIEIRNLCFRYGKQMVLNNLNLDYSGKCTLWIFRIIMVPERQLRFKYYLA